MGRDVELAGAQVVHDIRDDALHRQLAPLHEPLLLRLAPPVRVRLVPGPDIDGCGVLAQKAAVEVHNVRRLVPSLSWLFLIVLAGCASPRAAAPSPWSCAMSGEFAKTGGGTWSQLIASNDGGATLVLQRELANDGAGTLIFEVRNDDRGHVETLALERGGRAASSFEVPPGAVVSVHLVPPADAQGWYDFSCRVEP